MGSGEERRWGEKKVEGSGRTTDWDGGKRNGCVCFLLGADMVVD